MTDPFAHQWDDFDDVMRQVAEENANSPKRCGRCNTHVDDPTNFIHVHSSKITDGQIRGWTTYYCRENQ